MNRKFIFSSVFLSAGIIAFTLVINHASVQAESNGSAAYWKFDEGSGTTVSDSSGNNNGQISGNVSWVTGKVGKTLEFNGVDTFVTVPHNDNLNVAPGNKITISLWGYFTGWQSGYYAGVVLDKRTEGWAGYNWEYNNSEMQMRVHAGGQFWLVAVPHKLNTWNYYTMVLDGSTLKGYLNGELKVTRSDIPSVGKNTENLYLGQTVFPPHIVRGEYRCGSQIGPECSFRIKGALDEVRIYNRALSDSEVKELAAIAPTSPLLGNCGDENACVKYCNDYSHSEECLAYAGSHNLNGKPKLRKVMGELRHIAMAKKKGLLLPGNCTSRDTCGAYCLDTAHSDECVTFYEQAEFLSPTMRTYAQKLLPLLIKDETPGSCGPKEQCDEYCSDPTHAEECIAFEEKVGIIGREEAATARKTIPFLLNGETPGGCKTKESCETYCNGISHIDECVAFAKKTGILPPEQLKEAEQVQAALAKGVQPPPCKNKDECDVYCSKPSNMKVCTAFGEAAGFLQGQELQDAKKVVAAIDAGATPPPCKGKDTCDAYCSQPDHMEACLTFAQAAGLLSPQEMQDAQKAFGAIKKGVKPPACRGKGECDKYCGQDEHFDECTNFAVAAGFMSEKDAEMARKTGGKGPGGCRSKDECETFCNNPNNQQTCFNFAKDNGLISPEALQQMQEGQKRFQESFQNMPPEVIACLQNSIGSDMLEKFKSGQSMPTRDIGEKIGQCFSKMGGPGGAPYGAGGPPSQGMGPGGPMGAPGQQGGPNGTLGFPPISVWPQEVQECVKSAVDSEKFQELQSGSIKNEDARELFEKIKSCFGKSGSPQMPPQGMMPGYQSSSGTRPNMQPPVPGGQQSAGAPLPPETITCLKNIYSSDLIDKVIRGEAAPPADLKDKIQQCYASGSNLPPVIVNCVKSMYGNDFFDRMNSGRISQSEMQQDIQACFIKMSTGTPPPNASSTQPPAGTMFPSGLQPGFYAPPIAPSSTYPAASSSLTVPPPTQPSPLPTQPPPPPPATSSFLGGPALGNLLQIFTPLLGL